MHIQTEIVSINGRKIEYRFTAPSQKSGPVLLFLHEGLGCVSLWRDFPDRLSRATGLNAFVYSRFGYGRSDPAGLPRSTVFMHEEAAVLDSIRCVFSLDDVILIGHSDGASIALIHAGRETVAGIRGIILEAPHVFVEEYCLSHIAEVNEQYRTSDLRSKLQRHHGDNVDGAFRGWNDVWLSPEFRSWNIESYLPSITVPLQLLQGTHDEYGTMEQIRRIEKGVRGATEVIIMNDCGHAPHREYPDETLAIMTSFVKSIIV